jgi:hypothetical protein
MKPTYNRKKELDGYQIGQNISIHGHINDPESWHLTCRPLKIHGERLCEKGLAESEIAKYVYQLINSKRVVINELLNEVYPYT